MAPDKGKGKKGSESPAKPAPARQYSITSFLPKFAASTQVQLAASNKDTDSHRPAKKARVSFKDDSSPIKANPSSSSPQYRPGKGATVIDLTGDDDESTAERQENVMWADKYAPRDKVLIRSAPEH